MRIDPRGAALLLTFIATLIIVSMLAGCGTTPKQRYATMAESVTAAQNSLVQLHTAGTIDDQEFREAYHWTRLARGAVKSARASLDEGDHDQYLSAIQTAQRALASYQAYLIEAKGNPDEPDNDPDPGANGSRLGRASSQPAG
jgi:hypothetical protein